MPCIKTQRLKMITLSEDMMEAIVQGERVLYEKGTSYQLAPEWLLEVYKQFFPYKIDRFRKYPHENQWEGMMIDRKGFLVVGDRVQGWT